jgi:hypothetical protein
MKTGTHARHSKDAPDWQTPEDYVEGGRSAMGGIDLDPMSDDEAQKRVKAARYFTADDDGLKQVWYGNVFLNPAGGLVNKAWDKLHSSPQVRQFIFVGFSLEQLQTLQNASCGRHPLEFHHCITRRRIAFIESAARKTIRRKKWRADIAAGKEGVPKVFPEMTSPSHGNYICGWGMSGAAFRAAFERFGIVRTQHD